jgi:hypothetical protein
MLATLTPVDPMGSQGQGKMAKCQEGSPGFGAEQLPEVVPACYPPGTGLF